MLAHKKVIFYELNEVPWKVIDYFAARKPQSALSQVMAASRCYNTVTEDKGHLSPWITWPTLHRGVINAKHCIFDFGQNLKDVDEAYPSLWDYLASRGVNVGVFGSLHSYPLPSALDNYAFYVPDTFAAGSECFPKNLSVFQDFNLKAVQMSGRNVSTRFPLREAAQLMRAAPGLGLTVQTGISLASQILKERVNKARVGRRRTSQVELAFDFFVQKLVETTPDFASFFTNHVASSMHRYWPATFPQDYTQASFDPAWRSLYGDEISYTMEVASRQIDRLKTVADSLGYALVITSSMGQNAVDDGRAAIKTQLVIGNHAKFMEALGLKPGEWHPLMNMVPLYTYEIAPDAEESFQHRASRISINGVPLNVVKHGHGIYRLALGQTNLDLQLLEILVGNRKVGLEEIGFRNMSIDDEAGSNAYHIPEGSLLIYDPASPYRDDNRPSISTTEIAPAIIRNFGLDIPDYMSRSRGL